MRLKMTQIYTVVIERWVASPINLLRGQAHQGQFIISGQIFPICQGKLSLFGRNFKVCRGDPSFKMKMNIGPNSYSLDQKF